MATVNGTELVLFGAPENAPNAEGCAPFIDISIPNGNGSATHSWHHLSAAGKADNQKKYHNPPHKVYSVKHIFSLLHIPIHQLHVSGHISHRYKYN